MLSGIRVGILLITPCTKVFQPGRRIRRIICAVCLGACIVAVEVSPQQGVPKCSLVSVVGEDACIGKIHVGNGVIVCPIDGIVGMRAVTRVCDWPCALLLQAVVGESFPETMLLHVCERRFLTCDKCNIH